MLPRHIDSGLDQKVVDRRLGEFAIAPIKASCACAYLFWYFDANASLAAETEASPKIGNPSGQADVAVFLHEVG